mmetsp:Transcript_4812/g.12153  ORF Transcript_4812/g.12153 Transcript_4812/m.12153 type:complete len:233 (-) Transcript_4812:34-732(-)
MWALESFKKLAAETQQRAAKVSSKVGEWSKEVQAHLDKRVETYGDWMTEEGEEGGGAAGGGAGGGGVGGGARVIIVEAFTATEAPGISAARREARVPSVALASKVCLMAVMLMLSAPSAPLPVPAPPEDASVPTTGAAKVVVVMRTTGRATHCTVLASTAAVTDPCSTTPAFSSSAATLPDTDTAAAAAPEATPTAAPVIEAAMAAAAAPAPVSISKFTVVVVVAVAFALLL